MYDYSNYDASDLMEALCEPFEDNEDVNVFEELDKALPDGILTKALERIAEKYGIDLA